MYATPSLHGEGVFLCGPGRCAHTEPILSALRTTVPTTSVPGQTAAPGQSSTPRTPPTMPGHFLPRSATARSRSIHLGIQTAASANLPQQARPDHDTPESADHLPTRSQTLVTRLRIRFPIPIPNQLFLSEIRLPASKIQTEDPSI